MKSRFISLINLISSGERNSFGEYNSKLFSSAYNATGDFEICIPRLAFLDGDVYTPLSSYPPVIIFCKVGIEKGAVPHFIHQKIYDTYSFDRLQLLGTALNNLTKMEGIPVVYITLSQKELNQNNFKKGDTEGFVNYGLSLLGISLAVIMIENEAEKIIKMSFRSKGSFDVNQFAKKHFNGGGHINAAGGVSHLTLAETVSRFRNAVADEKSYFDV